VPRTGPSRRPRQSLWGSVFRQQRG
jgi:hypothetical protein